ncbi:DsbA family protein [Bacillus sp. FJAT-49705]|uniref:DsbA family protein n=1 Tax=Cytobacillus citreus TaxID=2833586 RepID=A0ABS5NRM7_9BACI|nr:DsbA family protein [Cytobacillus citreus]MBS4190456.1 DsbA family protein [Cytobacillus citreus]
MTNKKNSSFKLVMIITVLIFAALSAAVILNNKSSETDKDISYDKQPSIEGQPTLGDPDAPVTVVEFADFKCPACKSWSETFFPQIMEDYVDKGDVKISFVHVLFHGDESKLGSLAAEAVYKQSPESYWTFNKELFKAQPTNANHDDVWLTMDLINEIASSIPGINLEQLEKDMQDQSVIDEVNKDSKLVEEFKVELTPSIMVNGTMLEDPFDYEKIKSLIDEALKGKDK